MDPIVVTEICRTLSAARKAHGFALRAQRRAGVALLREVLAIAAPLLRLETRPMPLLRHQKCEGGEYAGSGFRDFGRGCLLVDETERQELRDGTQEDGPVLWWTAKGLVVAERHTYDARVWCRGECDPSYDWIETPRYLGLREVVRRYGAEAIVRAICATLQRYEEAHVEQRNALVREEARWIDAVKALRIRGERA